MKSTGTLRRVAGAIAGPRDTRRLALTHAIDDFADAMINLSLVGSLFFSVSVEASRFRILSYLVLAVAPLAVVAPAIGPLLDRTRLGFKSLMVGTHATRAVLSLALAASLLSVRFYPLVFGILLSRKAYALVKTAMIAKLASDQQTLVSASGHIARSGTIAGGIGTSAAGTLLVTVGAEGLLIAASGVYLLAGAVALTIPVTGVEARTPTRLRGALAPGIRSATFAVSTIRAATGALTFLLAFAIKRGGAQEWIYGLALVAAGVGAFTGTMLAPRLHRQMTPERVVVLTLLVPGLASAFGVVIIGNVSTVVIAIAIGLGASVATRTMDTMYGRVAEDVRGRVISRSELIFQLANVTGAALAVLISPGTRSGFATVAAVLVIGGIAYASNQRFSLRRETADLLIGRRTAEEIELADQLLFEAETANAAGRHEVAIVIAGTAARTWLARSGKVNDDLSEVLAIADDVTFGALHPSSEVADEVIAIARTTIRAPAQVGDEGGRSSGSP